MRAPVCSTGLERCGRTESGGAQGAGGALGGGVPRRAGDAVLSGPAARARARQPRAHAVSARPRPDRALEGVPAAEAQDAGVHRPGGRPLPNPPHAHARDVLHRADGGAGAGAQRGPHGGDRARPRSGPSRRSGTSARRRSTGRCASAGWRRAFTTTCTRCGWWTSSSATATASTSPSRCATGSSTTPARGSRARSRGGWCGWSTASPTSTTTSTTRCAPGCWPRRTCRSRRSSCSARPARRGSTRSCATSSRARAAPTTSPSPRRSAARCCACASSCSNGSIWARRRGASTIGSTAPSRGCSTTTWPRGTRSRPSSTTSQG